MSSISKQNGVKAAIPRRAFRQAMKAATPEGNEGIKWSEDAVILLQSAVENEMIDFFTMTQKVATHSKRRGITERDVKLTIDIRS